MHEVSTRILPLSSSNIYNIESENKSITLSKVHFRSSWFSAASYKFKILWSICENALEVDCVQRKADIWF